MLEEGHGGAAWEFAGGGPPGAGGGGRAGEGMGGIFSCKGGLSRYVL